MNHYGVIMAGGGGTRFWPLSRQKTPKQLLNLSGKDLMVNEAVERMATVIGKSNIFIVTADVQAPAMITATQGKVFPRNILAEPAARNTAACIGYSAMEILRKYGDGVMIITPADHYIEDVPALTEIFKTAILTAEEQDKLVTIGLKPTFPSTGFGYIKYDPQTDLLPLYGSAESTGGLMREIAEAAGVEPDQILGHDLFLYGRQNASVWGAGDDYFSCGRIDDLECAWACMTALIRSTARETVNVCAVFDNEEVGSGSRQGADSGFLYDTLTRLGFALGASDGEIRAAMAGSFLVSADNAHAVHPNHPEKYDKQNRPVMNGGVVIKHNANLKYTTDALSSARFALICQKAGVPVQHFANRSDIAGGSTLGHISAAHVSVESVDIGLAQLAMHSLYETAGTRDLPMLVRALEEMWNG